MAQPGPVEVKPNSSPLFCIPHTGILVSVCVFVCLLYGPQDLPSSDILAALPKKVTEAFLSALALWLPTQRYSLLYRGSRDGMSPSAFHQQCDGKGPTLVLIRCDEGSVFGGYTDASWDSDSGEVEGPGSFLFSVFGGLYRPARYLVRVSSSHEALFCRASYGPMFNAGLEVKSVGGAYAPFDSSSVCLLGEESAYECRRGDNHLLLTQEQHFTPEDIEVFVVTRRKKRGGFRFDADDGGTP